MLINSPNISGSLTVTGNAVITGSLTVAGGINATITGSATSASYVEYSNVANKPALVSGSSQVTYSGLTGVPSGIVSGSSQITYSGISSIPSGIVSSSTQVTGYSVFATTGSNQFNGSQAITGSLTVTGQVVAQTLNVQQVTSSIVYSSGSNIFGNTLGNIQQFTGSLQVSGSSHNILGNVGMGTTSPAARLQIIRDGTGSSNTSLDGSQLILSRTTGNSENIVFRNTGASNGISGTSYAGQIISHGNNILEIYTNVSNPIIFGTDATERMRITPSGSIEIGTTGFSSPSGADKFIGVFGGQDCSLILQDSVQLWELYVNDDFYINRGSTNVLTLNRTTGAATFNGDVAVSKAGTYSQIQLIDNTASGSTWITLSGFPALGDYTIREAGVANHLVIKKTTGNVGIGTTTPSGNLHVNANSGLLTQDILIVQGGGSPSGNFGFSVKANNGDKIFYTDNLTYNVLANTAGGKFGIGTASPNEKLHVVGAITATGTATTAIASSSTIDYYSFATRFISRGADNSTRGSYRFLIEAANGSLSVDAFSVTNGGTVQVGGWGTGTDVSLRINGNSNGQVAFFNHNGQLYVPFLDTSTGTDLVLTSGGYINKKSSSIRYKENIESIDIGLDFIMSLNPVKFDMKSDGLAQVGFIAEEFPDERLVTFSQVNIEDVSKGLQRESINYAQIVAPLVKAIQEQQSQIEILKTKIEILEQS